MFLYMCIENHDYFHGQHTITIPAGSTKWKFNITILNDKILEANETFYVSILSSSLPDHVSTTNSSQTSVTIIDDDCK